MDTKLSSLKNKPLKIFERKSVHIEITESRQFNKYTCTEIIILDSWINC